jgi:hypothetical protein
MSVAVAPLPLSSPVGASTTTVPLSSPTTTTTTTTTTIGGAATVTITPLDIKPLAVSAGGWRPRFMRGGGAPPPTLAVTPPNDAPAATRASSLPSAHTTNDQRSCDPLDLPDRSHSATAPPSSSCASDNNAPPLPRASSLSSPASSLSSATSLPSLWSMSSSESSSSASSSLAGSRAPSSLSLSSGGGGDGNGSTSGAAAAADSVPMPSGSPTFYSQDSRPSPAIGTGHLLLPRSSATFTKSPSRPHLLRAEANLQAQQLMNNNNGGNPATSPNNVNHTNDLISPSDMGNTGWHNGSGSSVTPSTPSHAAVTAHGLRHVQLDFQLLRQMRSDGVNGAYQIADAAGNRVIFKPNDEESFDVRTVPVSSIPAKDLAAALPSIAKQAQAAGFRGSREFVALAQHAGTLLKAGSNQHYISNNMNNMMNNNDSPNNSQRGGLGGRRGGAVSIAINKGGSSYVGHGHHATNYHNFRQNHAGGPARVHHRRRRRTRRRQHTGGIDISSNNVSNNNNTSRNTNDNNNDNTNDSNNNTLDDDDIIGGRSYTPPHIDTDDESSPSPLPSRRASMSSHSHGVMITDEEKRPAVDSPSQLGESDSVLPSPPAHSIASSSNSVSSSPVPSPTSDSSSTDGGLSLVNQYMTPYLAPGQSMRMFKHDPNPCGPGVPRGVAWVSGRGHDLMLNIKVSPRRGVAYGDTTHKEWAAYLLDHGRFSGVPRTITASVNMYHGGTLLHTGPGSASSSPASSPHSTAPVALKRLTSSAGEDQHGSNVATTSSPSPSTSPVFVPSINDSPPMTVSLEGTSTSIQSLQPEPRYGSLQEFKEHICSAEDMGNSQFSVDEVHKIGILDLRLVNLDRHLGNILVAKVPPNERVRMGPEYKLIPIDHGYILPDYRDIADVNFEWIHWKQCKEAFSATSLAYIASLDPVHDATLLKDVGVRNGSIITCVIATIMLQRAAAAGLTLCNIAQMAQRSGMGEEKEKSTLERIVAQTDEAMTTDDGCHNHSNGHITTDDELDDDVIHAINRGPTATNGIRGRGRGGGVGRGTRTWGRAFTKTSRSAPLPSIAASSPSSIDDDDELLFKHKSSSRYDGRHHDHIANGSSRRGALGRANARRRAAMSLEDQMDDNVHFMGQAAPSHHVDEGHHAVDSPSSIIRPHHDHDHAAVRREMDFALSTKKKNLLTSPMMNPMSGPSGVRPAPLLRHASDQVYQNGVGMTLMPDSESPALRPIDGHATSNGDDDMESLSLDGVAARIGSPVTSPTKARSLANHAHIGGHGFVPRSSRVAASSAWSASASPSTSPPSVSLFNRSNTLNANTTSSLLSSMMSSTRSDSSSYTASSSTSSSSTTSTLSHMAAAGRGVSPASSPSHSPPGGSPVVSPSFGPLGSKPAIPKSSRARPTISDGVIGKKRSDTTSLSRNSNNNITIANGVQRSRPLPIRAAASRASGSGVNSTVTSPAISPVVAASPPSPAALPLRMPTPMPSPSPPDPFTSPPISPPQGSISSSGPSTPLSARGSPLLVPSSIHEVTTSSGSASSSPIAATSSTASASTSTSTTPTAVLHRPSSPPSSWRAATTASTSSTSTSAATATTSSSDASSLPGLPRAAVPLRASPSMELVRASGPSIPPHIRSTSDGSSRACGGGGSLPPVGEAEPPRRYAWNEAWLTRFMKVVTNAVDHEVSKLVRHHNNVAAASSSTTSSSSRNTSR